VDAERHYSKPASSTTSSGGYYRSLPGVLRSFIDTAEYGGR
jgi:hypothetical protein